MNTFARVVTCVCVLGLVASSVHAQRAARPRTRNRAAQTAVAPAPAAEPVQPQPSTTLTLEQEMAAAESEAPTTTAAPTETPSDTPVNDALRDDQAIYEEEVGVERVDDGLSPIERPDTDYFFVGPVLRLVWLPDFIQNLAVSYTGPHAANGAIGAQFNYRRNGFNVIAEVNYTGFGNDGFYRGKDAADFDVEFVRSNLGVLFGSAHFSWSIELMPVLALELGLGIGLGATVGNIYRQEAQPNGSGGYTMCNGQSGGYCESPVESPNASTGRLDSGRNFGGTYQVSNNTPNPFYFGDGGIPPIMLWLDLPRVALRFKPIRQVQIRAEAGYNVYGFSFGASVGYGL